MEQDAQSQTLDAGPPADAQLEALTRQLDALQQAQRAQQQHEKQQQGTSGTTPAEQTFFGYTFGALFLALVISTVGIAYVRYAKVTSELAPFLVGVALFVMTYFITDALALFVSAAGVIGLHLVARRFVRF